MSAAARTRAPTGVCVVRVEPRDRVGVLISVTVDPDVEAHRTPRQAWHFTEAGPAAQLVEAFLHMYAEGGGPRRPTGPEDV